MNVTPVPSTAELRIDLTESQRRQLLDRVDPELCARFKDLVEALKDSDASEVSRWRRLYDLALVAGRVPPEERWRLSEFALLLRASGVTNPGTYAVAYAHCVSVALLSLSNEEPGDELPLV